MPRTPLIQGQSWSLISYLSIAQNPSDTGTVVVAYIISFLCPEPLFYRDSRGHLYHIFPLPRTPLLQGQSWSLISYLSIAQNPSSTGTVVVVYIISFHCTEPLCYRDSRGHLYHIFPLPRTPLLQGQSWSLISYLSIAQNPSSTGAVVVVYIISFHCTEPLCYRDSRGRLYHIFPLHRTPLLQGQSWSLISYLSIAQNPFATGTVVVVYIISFHCTEPLCYRDSRGHLYHIFPLHRTPLLQRQSWSLISYLSIAQNPSSTGTVVVVYIISFHCTEPLCYRDSRGHLYHIFPLHRTPLLQGQSWSFISYLSIAQNPFATGTVVVTYIISFHCTEPLFYRDSRGRLYHIFPLHRTPLLQRQSWSFISYLSIAQNPSSTETVVVVYIISFHCTEPLCYRDSRGRLYHIFPLHRTPLLQGQSWSFISYLSIAQNPSATETVVVTYIISFHCTEPLCYRDSRGRLYHIFPLHRTPLLQGQSWSFISYLSIAQNPSATGTVVVVYIISFHCTEPLCYRDSRGHLYHIFPLHRTPLLQGQSWSFISYLSIAQNPSATGTVVVVYIISFHCTEPLFYRDSHGRLYHIFPLPRTPLLQGQSWSFISYLSIAQNPSSTETVMVAYIISFHCPEPLFYRDSRGRLYHIFPLHRTPLLQRQSWSFISYLSIAQNPSSTETVVVAYIISFHCTEPLFYRDSHGRLYHIFPLPRTPLLQRQSWSLISYLSIAQNPSSTGTVVVTYIISFHCTEPLFYRDSRGRLYHIFPLHRTPLATGTVVVTYIISFHCTEPLFYRDSRGRLYHIFPLHRTPLLQGQSWSFISYLSIAQNPSSTGTVVVVYIISFHCTEPLCYRDSRGHLYLIFPLHRTPLLQGQSWSFISYLSIAQNPSSTGTVVVAYIISFHCTEPLCYRDSRGRLYHIFPLHRTPLLEPLSIATGTVVVAYIISFHCTEPLCYRDSRGRLYHIFPLHRTPLLQGQSWSLISYLSIATGTVVVVYIISFHCTEPLWGQSWSFISYLSIAQNPSSTGTVVVVYIISFHCTEPLFYRDSRGHLYHIFPLHRTPLLQGQSWSFISYLSIAQNPSSTGTVVVAYIISFHCTEPLCYRDSRGRLYHIFPLHRTPLLQGQSWSLISYLSIAQNPSATGTVVVVYIISFHCTEPLFYRDSHGRLYHIFPLHRTPLLQGQSWSLISYLSIAQNPSSTGTVVVAYIISFHCPEPLFYRDSRGRLYHIFPLHRTPLLQGQSWSLISYLSIAQNPSSTGTVVVAYIISFHCPEPLFYRDSRGRLYHIFPLHRTPLLQGQSWSLISYLSIAQNPSSTGTVVVAYIISFHCTEPLFYRDSRGRLYHIFPLPRTPLATGTVVVAYIISFHCPEPLFYRDSRGRDRIIVGFTITYAIGVYHH